jgi:hypothetical protein
MSVGFHPEGSVQVLTIQMIAKMIPILSLTAEVLTALGGPVLLLLATTPEVLLLPFIMRRATLLM